MSTIRSGLRTVENGTLEKTEELEEHVLLLGCELVITGMFSSVGHVGLAQTLPHVGVHPFFRCHELSFGTLLLLLLLPEFPGRGLLFIVVEGRSRAQTIGGIISYDSMTDDRVGS